MYIYNKHACTHADNSTLCTRYIYRSVLVVAGGFKRQEPDLLEEALLMRALRDFNIPKIVRIIRIYI